MTKKQAAQQQPAANTEPVMDLPYVEDGLAAFRAIGAEVTTSFDPPGLIVSAPGQQSVFIPRPRATHGPVVEAPSDEEGPLTPATALRWLEDHAIGNWHSVDVYDGKKLKTRYTLRDGAVRITDFHLTVKDDDAGFDVAVVQAALKRAQKAAEMEVAASVQELLQPGSNADDGIYFGDEAFALRAKVTGDLVKRRRTRHWDDKKLREASRIYLEAKREGDPVRRAVEVHFQIAPATAARVIKMAQDRGQMAAVEAEMGAEDEQA